MDNKYFKVAGDLKENSPQNTNQNSFFKPARNLTEYKQTKLSVNQETSNNELTKEEIENYLITIVSGEPLDFENELGTICGGGKMIVTFKELQVMADTNCYNFIKAQCLNPNMIVIEYQQYKPFDKTMSI